MNEFMIMIIWLNDDDDDEKDEKIDDNDDDKQLTAINSTNILTWYELLSHY